MFKTISSILVVLMCLSVNGELAEELKPCKYGDTECIKSTINFLLKEKSQGFEAINLPQLNPIRYEKVHLQQGGESSVTLDLVLKNQSLYGLDTAKAVKVKGFGKNLTTKHNLKIHADYLSTVGEYEVKGKILILPVVGSGELNITFVDLDLFFSFVGKSREKDGATYMDIENLTLSAEPKDIIFKIDNLFNGDKVLGDNMNLFLNENSQEIYKEIRNSLGKAFSEVFKNIIQGVFSKYPYDKYFTD